MGKNPLVLTPQVSKPSNPQQAEHGQKRTFLNPHRLGGREDAIPKPVWEGTPSFTQGWPEAGVLGPAPPAEAMPPGTMGAHSHTRTHAQPYLSREKEPWWEGRTGAEPGAGSRDRPGSPVIPSEGETLPTPGAKAAPICSARGTPVAIFVRGCLRGSSRFIPSPLS